MAGMAGGGGGDASGRPHPSLDITGSDGTELASKRIVLCVSGSVAAYKAVELARLLMRHGADVRCVVSGAAARLIRPDYFTWATGNEAVTRLTGRLEHIGLADYGMADLIIAYPATANTLGKLANGIDDTPVSTVLAVGLGSGTPILACPAMHEAMYESPAVARNVEFLRGRIRFLDPQMAEGKAKAAEPDDVLKYVLDTRDGGDARTGGGASALRGKRVLVTAGPTMEHIDPVRAITNISTGRTGTLLASELVRAGAEVTLIYGPGDAVPPGGARVVNVRTGRQMLEAARAEMRERFDIIIMAAAAADYVPERASRTKIKSDRQSLTVRLRKAPKIIDMVRKMQPDALLVGFKAEANVARDTLVRSARRRLRETGADMIVANDIGAKYQSNPDRNQVFIVDGGKKTSSSGWAGKEEIARFIASEIQERAEAR